MSPYSGFDTERCKKYTDARRETFVVLWQYFMSNGPASFPRESCLFGRWTGWGVSPPARPGRREIRRPPWSQGPGALTAARCPPKIRVIHIGPGREVHARV